MSPAAWWSPTQGYLVPAVGRGDPPLAADGQVKRVADSYVVPVPDDVVELGPLAVDAQDVEDALSYYDLSDTRAADITSYLSERRAGRAQLQREYAARPGGEKAMSPSPLEMSIFEQLLATYVAKLDEAARVIVEGAGTGEPLGLLDATAAAPVDPVTEGRPALAWLLGKGRSTGSGAHWPFVGPDGECAECPFGTPSYERDPRQYPPNPADPGEGRYDCSLLERRDIWGEGPPCTEVDWAARARVELSAEPAERTPRERLVRHLERTVAGVTEAGWAWLAVDLAELVSHVRHPRHQRDPVDVEAVWRAIEAAD